MSKRIVLRQLAELDVDSAFEHYLAEASPDGAWRFMETLGVACSHIAANPGTGSPRHAMKLNVGGLRFWSLGRYPYLVFYFEMPDRIDVIRVLHSSMDVARHLGVDPRTPKAEEPAAAYAVESMAEWA